jgi:Ala-tRNA(Pro) deacylase
MSQWWQARSHAREEDMSCQDELKKLLRGMELKYECRSHREEDTAAAVAHSEHLPLAEMAKVVICVADNQLAMFVIPTSGRLDLDKAARAAGVQCVWLAREDEFQAAFPDCEEGAMPPFGNLYGIPTFVDPALIQEPEIVFQAGSHTETIAMKPSDYLEVSGAEVAKLVCDAPKEEHRSGLLLETPL